MKKDAIVVSHLEKSFKVYPDKGSSLKEKLLFLKRNAYDRRQVLKDISFTVSPGEAVALIGRNGCGKSTLFKIILGELPADSGTVKLGANIKIGYFDQIQKLFHTERTVLAEIWDSFPKLGETEIRKALAAFLFTGKDLEKPCTVLSGGERARLGLLKIMLSGANFLLLDEPTNHLDIASREALETALADYEGTILAISHDRYFINRLASRILQMHDHQITNYLGDYDYYLEKKATLLQNQQIENNNKPTAASANKLDYQARKELASQRRKLTTQLTKTENNISQLEETIQTLEETLGQPEVATDFAKSMDYSNQLETAKEELDAAMLQWEEISLALEALPSEKV